MAGGRKLRSLLFALIAIFFIASSIYIYWKPSNRFYSAHYADAPVDPLRGRQKAFWKEFQSVLTRHEPRVPPPNRISSAPALHFDAFDPPARPDLVIFPDDDIEKMRAAHAAFVTEIKSPDQHLKPVHTVGTRGIVSTAGGSYFPVFLASLRMLRRTGSTLPVEVFVKDSSEYEAELCEEILPGFNARCIILSELLGAQDRKGKSEGLIEHYQLKTFAVLFSSFEDIIWMDADCFPLHKPETLLDSEPFKSTGLVTWPDFWASTISPLYYQISQQDMTPLETRASSETGVFLVSKRSHFPTLLLAAYYNFYGPNHYFPLLSQGAPGEGDKETFLQAASAVQEPFYAVSERVQAIGHKAREGSDGISGSAMVQFDPMADYTLTTEKHLYRVKDPSVADRPRAFFIHANYPKFNPAENVFGHKWETEPTLRPDGSDSRAWLVPEDVIRSFGVDAEKMYWEEIGYVACHFERKFRSWQQKQGVCDRVTKYWQNVFATAHDDDPKFE